MPYAIACSRSPRRSSTSSIPTREPHESVVDAAGRPDFGRNTRVRHGRRMTDQRLDAPQALGQAEQPGAREQPPGGLGPAMQSHADHAPEIAHLAPGHVVIGMVGQAWIINTCDLRLLRQPGRERSGILAMPLHPHAERLDAAEHEP